MNEGPLIVEGRSIDAAAELEIARVKICEEVANQLGHYSIVSTLQMTMSKIRRGNTRKVRNGRAMSSADDDSELRCGKRRAALLRGSESIAEREDSRRWMMRQLSNRAKGVST